MRFFELLNTQQVFALTLLAAIFAILFGTALWGLPMFGDKSRVPNSKIVQRFIDGIEKADGPFPMFMALLIGASVLWALYYILFYGLSEVKL